MAVFPGSRQQNQQKFTANYTNSLGQVRVVSWLTMRKSIEFQNFPDNVNVTMWVGGTLQAIAQQFYNDPGLWWVIAEFNNITDPFPIEQGGELSVNQILVVPSYQKVITSILPNA